MRSDARRMPADGPRNISRPGSVSGSPVRSDRVEADGRESAWVAQTSHRHRDEPAERSLRSLAAASRESVHAVARELVRRHIVPDIACLRGRR